MAEQIEEVVIDMNVRDAASAGVAKITAAIEQLGEVTRKVNELTAGLTGPLGQIAGGLGIYEVVTKSLAAAKEADQAVARLKTSLGGSDGLVKQIQDLAKSLSDSSVYSSSNILTVAADLLNRGVPQSQLPQTLKATIDLASALRISLDQAGHELAATFGGTVPRDLGRALPQLRDMTKQSLELGGALDIIEQKFGGQAAGLAATPFGKAEQEANALGDQYERLGDELIKIENEVLPGIIGLLSALNDGLGSPAGQKFVQLLGEAVPLTVKMGLGLGAVSVAIRALGPASEIVEGLGSAIKSVATAADAATASTGRLTAAQRRLQAMRSQNIFVGASAAAGGYLGYQAGGDQGAILGALGASALSSSGGMVGMVGGAALVADALYTLVSRLLGVNTQFDSFDKQLKLAGDYLNYLAAKDGRTAGQKVGDTVAGGLSLVGIDQNTAPLTADDVRRMHLPASYIGTSGSADSVNAQIAADNAAAPSGDQLIAARNAKYEQQFEQLTKEFSDVETQGSKQTSDQVEKQDEESNKRKYAAQLESLQQYLSTERQQELSAIQKRMADDQEQIHALDEQALRDRASGLKENALQEMQRRNALQREYNDLLAQSKELQQAQAEEALELSARQAALADESLQKSVGRTRDLVSQGVVSPEQGRTDVMGSLAAYQARIEDVRTVLESLATVPGEIGIEARQAIAALDAEAQDVADKTVKAVSDIRTVGQASQDAADSIQKSFQQGLSKFLDDIIERSTTAKKAWQDLEKTLLNSVVGQTTQRLSEQIAGLLSGGVQGGGLFGLLGAATEGNVKGAASGAGNLAGSLLGGLQTLLGAAGSGSGGTSAPAQSSGSSGGGGGGILGGVVGLLGGLLKLFDSGGYTGNGSPSSVAGLVHGGEYVVPASAVKNFGGPDALGQFISSAMPSVSSPSISFGSAGAGGSSSALDRLHAAAGSLENVTKNMSASGGTTVVPAVAVNEDLINQINNHPASARTVADMMLKNPSTFAPAVKQLSKQ